MTQQEADFPAPGRARLRLPTTTGTIPPTAVLAARLRMSLALVLRRTREEAAGSGVSPTQLSILGRLERRPGMTATDLAAAEGLRPQSVRNLIDELRDEGFIDGVRDSSDARRVNLTLTERGRDFVHGLRHPGEPVLARLLVDSFDENEIRTLTAAVTLLERLAYAPTPAS
ncbi:MarR family winged helix-turn-helix transcriptional regulator [Nocardia nova]|uniref:MarR family winged helix-turn-helix transcriptional regulator n=1 Tax=Nocardia nova TaxID=37330 RepID=UPI00130DA22F|nr:MarR family transcriptional regulator [Nocardia nova]